MDNVIFVIIYYIHSVPGGEFIVIKHLKMHKSVVKPKVLPYISPYLSSITCGTDAANRKILLYERFIYIFKKRTSLP